MRLEKRRAMSLGTRYIFGTTEGEILGERYL